MSGKLYLLTRKVESSFFVRTIRSGLTTIIPVIMIGAFALLGRSFPIPSYTDFIMSFSGGTIYEFFSMAYSATFGMLSIYMVVSISMGYIRESHIKQKNAFAVVASSLICFFILSGTFHTGFTIDSFGPKGMIIAILSGYMAPALYCKLAKHFNKRKKIYSESSDLQFNNAASAIMPLVICSLFIAVLNEAVSIISGGLTIYQAVIKLLEHLFTKIGVNFLGGLFFIVLSSILWFMGIHGSDCLESIMEKLYTPNLAVNASQFSAGFAPTNILTKQFFDVFVLMGGCGAAICLVLSLIIFGKRQSDRKLASFAFPSMLFNINEIMIFGLPIIWNPIMLIPFLLTPVVCYLTSFAAMSLGLVQLTISSVEWTTPVLLGGYMATGSVSGTLLQLFNILLGILIYAPFVRLMDKRRTLESKENYSSLVELLKVHEENRTEIVLSELEDLRGEIARMLLSDLSNFKEKNFIELYYQPQYDYDGQCIGAEALLRWKHPSFGNIYPPLVIKLAKEAKILRELDEYIIKKAIDSLSDFHSAAGSTAKLSVNVTGDTLSSEEFIPFLYESGKSGLNGLCIEITEQTAIKFDSATIKALSEIKKMGIQLAIDDFSMGQTSINFLKEKYFDIVKLDGSLISGMIDNPRCIEIISAITSLSKNLGILVLAEFVESTDERDILAQIGCRLYQGYLYSPAITFEEFKERLKK